MTECLQSCTEGSAQLRESLHEASQKPERSPAGRGASVNLLPAELKTAARRTSLPPRPAGLRAPPPFRPAGQERAAAHRLLTAAAAIEALRERTETPGLARRRERATSVQPPRSGERESESRPPRESCPPPFPAQSSRGAPSAPAGLPRRSRRPVA
ncbi:hypothetical protein E2320_014425 [Naja naja]|nr:hypothetical protein E2320_014425 [Naja naja]